MASEKWVKQFPIIAKSLLFSMISREHPLSRKKTTLMFSDIRKPKVSKRKVNWHLVMIGDHGKVIDLNQNRFMITIALVVFCVAVISAGGLFFLFQKSRMENRSLEESVTLSEKLIDSLKAEREVLAARLIVAGIKPELKKEYAENSIGIARDDLLKKRGTGKSALDGKNPGENSSLAKKKDPVPAVTGIASDDHQWPDRSHLVSLSDFEANHDPTNNRLRLQFKLTNTSSQRLTGYLFVLLKNDQKSPDTWQLLPMESLENAIPSDYKSGRKFSILKFKTIRFESRDYQKLGRVFEVAVLVFGNDGEFILKNEFPVEM